MNQFRHGDLLIESVKEIPASAKIRKNNVAAYGEVTGHSHAVLDGVLYEDAQGTVYIRASAGTVITHEEHGQIALPEGDYIVTHQREYDPWEQAARQVMD